METEIMMDLRRSILEFNRELAITSAKRAVEENLNLIEALNVVTSAARQVGDAFQRGDLWLPELVAVGDILSKALPIIEEELLRRGMEKKSVGIVVIGTVHGDIHNTGKRMVAAFLTGAGFKVHDLGENVPPEKFIEAVKIYNADILAMSALMTTTLGGMERTIGALRKEGIRDRVKIMVGGGPITQEYADGIGADGYRPTAVGAVELARRLLKIEEVENVKGV